MVKIRIIFRKASAWLYKVNLKKANTIRRCSQISSQVGSSSYPPLPTCSNRRFQGFDDKKKKKDIDFDHVHCGTRQAVQFRLFVYRSKHASLPIAMKKAGGSFRKALDWSTHSESSLNNVKTLFQFDNRSYSVYLLCI